MSTLKTEKPFGHEFVALMRDGSRKIFALVGPLRQNRLRVRAGGAEHCHAMNKHPFIWILLGLAPVWLAIWWFSRAQVERANTRIDFGPPIQGMLVDSNCAYLLQDGTNVIRIWLASDFVLAVKDPAEPLPGKEGFWIVKLPNLGLQ